MRKGMLCLVAMALLAGLAVTAAGAQPTLGVTDDKILVGYTMPMSGPLGFMGSQTAYAVQSVFKKYNDQGGIYGRKLQLVTYDSGMDAGQALANYRKLVLEDKVFCVMFGFGSFVRPAYSFFEEQKVPWLFPWAPPEDMIFPAHKYLFNVFPTTASQMQVEASWVAQQNKWKRVACVYGDTASGKTGLEGLKAILKDSPVKLVASEAIATDATSAAVQVAKIGQANPDLVMIIGMVHQPAAVLIKEIRKVGLKTDLMVGQPLIGPTLPELLKGVDIDGLYGAWWGAIQWPDSKNTETPQMKEMRLRLMKEYPTVYDDESVGGSVEHGMSVEIFIEALKRAGKNLTRDGLIKALESLKNWDTGKGSYVTFSPTRHEGIAGGIMIQYKGGEWFPISKWIDVDVGQ